MGTARYEPSGLRRFCAGVFEKLGVGSEDAGIVADSLVRANLEGTDSHGISRLAIYARRIREGRISAAPEIRIERSGSVVRQHIRVRNSGSGDPTMHRANPR